MMQLHFAPLTQQCPYCGALQDEYCRPMSRTAQWATAAMHAARKALVAGWSDEQKRAALEQMLATRRERQRAGGAKVLAFPQRTSEEG